MTTQQFHNPQNLTPQQYGADQGWRLLTKDEVGASPNIEIQYSNIFGIWHTSSLQVGDELNSLLSYRTRAPLPVEENGWVKMSERRPTEADLPIVSGSYRNWKWDESSVCDQMGMWDDDRTHWFSVPRPPTPEPMTREEDHKAFYKQYAKLRTGDNGRRTMWDAAIAYERAKYRALIDRYNNSDLKAHEFIHAVGEMCK